MTEPSRDELIGLARGALNDDAAQRVAAFLDSSETAAGAMETLPAPNDPLVEALRRKSPPDPFVGESDCQRAMRFIEKIGQDASAADSGAAEQEAVAAAEPLGEVRDYVLLEKLGQGGMGSVYKARHKRLKRIVALKVLPADKLQDEQAVARFEREMEAVGALEHPNIVQAMDAGEHEGTHYLVMERVKGIDLSRLVARCGPLPIAEACELIRQAAVGLEHAHEHGMVHRDIKPSNLMLARSNRATAVVKLEPVGSDGSGHDERRRRDESDHYGPTVKILDMGLARLGHEAGRELTTTGQLMGTIDYMAPEQGGNSREVDIRADVYSLGASLYKLLTGEAPFGAANYDGPIQKLMALATEPIPPIPEKRADLPPELAALIHRMLAKSPAERPATPQEVAEALAPFASGADLASLVADVDEPEADDASIDRTLPSGEVRSTVDSLGPASAADRTMNLTHGIGDHTVGAADAPDVAVRAEGRSARHEKASPSAAVNAAGWFTGRRKWAALGAAAGGIALLLGLIVLFMQTPDGTVRIEIHDPQVQVTVEGETLKITQQNDEKPIVLEPGEHRLHVTRDGLEFNTDNFSLKQGDKVLLVVKLMEGEVRVLEGNRVIGRSAVPAEPIEPVPPVKPAVAPSTPQSRREAKEILAGIDWSRGGDTQLIGLAARPAQLEGIADWQVHGTTPASLRFNWFSPSGRYAVVCENDAVNPLTRIVDVQSGEVLGTTSISNYSNVSWSDDEERFALSIYLKGAYHCLICRRDGVVLSSLRLPESACRVAWRPGAEQLLVWHDGPIEMVDLEGEPFPGFTPVEHEGPGIHQIIWSPDGEHFSVETVEGVHVYAADGSHVLDLNIANPRGFVLWHPAGDRLLVFDRIWMLTGEKGPQISRGNAKFLAFSPAGRYLFRSDGKIFDMAGSERGQAPVPDWPDVPHQRHAVWDREDRIRIMSTEHVGWWSEVSPGGQVLGGRKPPFHHLVTSLSWRRDSDELRSVGGSSNNQLTTRPWEFSWSPPGAGLKATELSVENLWYAAFSPSSDDIALATHAFNNAVAKAYVLDDAEAAPRPLLDNPWDYLSWNSDGTRLAVSCRDYRIDVFAGDKRIASLNGHKDRIQGLAWQPDGETLVSWALDDATILWDVDGEEPVRRIENTILPQGAPKPNSQWKTCPTWSPDGEWLAVVKQDGVLLVPADGGEPRQLPRPEIKIGNVEEYFPVRWLEGGEWLLVGNVILDTDGKRLGTTPGMDQPHQIGYFAATDDLVLGVSWHNIYLWDKPDRQPLAIETPGLSWPWPPYRVYLRDRGVNSRIVSPSGRFLAAHTRRQATPQILYGGGDVAVFDLQEKRLAFVGASYSDGAQITVGPTGEILSGPDDVDPYLLYLLRYPETERVIPLTRSQFAARIGLPAGKRFAQKVLDHGGTLQVRGRSEPLAAADVPSADQLPDVGDIVGVDLSLSGNYYTDDELLAGLASLTALEELDVSGTQVSDASLLPAVEKFTHLRRLNLAGTRIENGLSTVLPKTLEVLDVSNTRVEDFFAYDLKRLENLQQVVLTGTKVKTEAVARLRSALPQCRVEYDASE